MEPYWNKISWTSALSPLLDSIEKWWIIDEKNSNQKILITASKHTEAFSPIEIGETLQTFLKISIDPFPITICTDPAWIPFSRIFPLAEKLRSELHQRLVMGKSYIIDLSQSSVLQLPSATIPGSAEKKIIHSIQNHKMSFLKKEFLELFSQWNLSDYPQNWIDSALKDILKIFQRELVSLSQSDLYSIEIKVHRLLSNASEFETIYPRIWEIFESLINRHYENKDSSAQLVKNIENYMQMNFSKDISVTDIAKQLSYAPSYITKIFKKSKGMTPQKYLISLRIEESKRLIEKEPALSLKTVGEMVGYPNPHYFSRVFKHETGKSPLQFKKRFKQ